jgi:hypothetical protein
VVDRRYRASPKGKETDKKFRRQAGVVEAAGNKRARELLEAHENNKRHAVQQKTNAPSCGVLGVCWAGASEYIGGYRGLLGGYHQLGFHRRSQGHARITLNKGGVANIYTNRLSLH